MTCSEAAQLIYDYCERVPLPKDLRALKEHLRLCQKCREFIEAMGKRFAAGQFEVACGEIPKELLENLSRIMRSLDHT